jgi:hypothetical protein
MRLNTRQAGGQDMSHSRNVERMRETPRSTDTTDASLAEEFLLKEELEAFKAIHIQVPTKIGEPSTQDDGVAQSLASPESGESSSDILDGLFISASAPGSRRGMDNFVHGILAPTSPQSSSPPPQSRRLPPTPESRIGIFLGQYLELKTILKTGAYGVVYSAFDHLTQTWYAVKTLSKINANGELLDKRQREFQSREIRLHYMASAHPNIVSVLNIVAA